MFEKYLINLITLVVLLGVPFASCDVDISGLLENIDLEAITIKPTGVSGDIDQAAYNDAWNLDDPGRYTTMDFHYFNAQNYFRVEDQWFARQGPCFFDYLRCLHSQILPAPICVFNAWKRHYDTFHTLTSYCDVFYDDCRRGWRKWFIVTQGHCKF